MSTDDISIPEPILATVRRCLAESLAVPIEEVTLDRRLVDDLGADSLDFVDLVFSLERELGIDVAESEFNFLTRLDFASPAVMKEGFLTPAVVDDLATWIPALAEVPDRAKVTPRQLFSALTVRAICIVAVRRAA